MAADDKLPTGEYTAKIVDVDISENVRFGNYIADVYKPVYSIIRNDNTELNGMEVKDNGVFKYKDISGHMFDKKKNWGYARFLKLMKLYDTSSRTTEPITKENIIFSTVGITVFIRSFTNSFSSFVSYPVARLEKLIVKGDFPF